MPELAEVEFYRKRWAAGEGARITEVQVHAAAKVFRGTTVSSLVATLTGARLVRSAAQAKQMLFTFAPAARRGGRAWLGIHLGMSGELRVEPSAYAAGKHDHLVLVQRDRQLVLNDPRMFGRVQFATGLEPPAWWTRIAPPILSPEFTLKAVSSFLDRRRRAPIKAVLLLQERFPGIGNWMADEILWRAGIHPRQPAGTLTAAERRALHRECRRVCRLALDTIAGRGKRLPVELNVAIPRSWLFPHRWRKGGRCPKTGAPLEHATIGGRTTCWSPARQRRHD